MPSDPIDHATLPPDRILAQFGRTVFREAVYDRAPNGIDALHVRRFQQLGVIGAVDPPVIPEAAHSVLRDPTHSLRQRLPVGPLIVVNDGDKNLVLEVATLLLHDSQALRTSAVEYLTSTCKQESPWLSPETIRRVHERSSDCCSGDAQRWQQAGIEVVPAIRDDFFAHLAGLEQSWALNLDDEASKYLGRVMRPTFRTLAFLRPPIWSPTEQAGEIDAWIEELAGESNLIDALNLYCKRCGYLPLCRKSSAGGLVDKWLSRDPQRKLCWPALVAWIKSRETPFVQYHGSIIAIHHLLSLGAAEQSELSEWIAELIGQVETDTLIVPPRWQLYNDLAAHFAHHVEALQPGQSSERIACFAWWLADRVGHLVASVESSIQPFIQGVLAPELSVSLLRWTIARSPIVPSMFWFATRYTNSVWALSLLRQLALAAQASPASEFPKSLRASVGKTLRGFCVATPINYPSPSVPIYAFDDKADILGLVAMDGFVSPEEKDLISHITELRIELYSTPKMVQRLGQLLDAPQYEQQLIAITLQEIAIASNNIDNDISSWLKDVESLVAILQRLPQHSLNPLLEALAELVLRPQLDSSIQIPHILAYAMEGCDDLDRVKRLNSYAIQMSVNVGIASPIQRILTSRWRSVLTDPISLWRENLLGIAQVSEPWVAARIRATSSAISRILGPHRHIPGAPGSSDSVEGDAK